MTADHGQIDVGNRVEMLGARGDGHGPLPVRRGPVPLGARPTRARPTTWPTCWRSSYGATTWVRTRDQLVDDGWFGGPLGAGSPTAWATWP